MYFYSFRYEYLHTHVLLKTKSLMNFFHFIKSHINTKCLTISPLIVFQLWHALWAISQRARKS